MLPPQDSLLSLTTVLARTQRTQVPEKPAVQDQNVSTPDRPSFEDQLRNRRSTKPEPESRTRADRAKPTAEESPNRSAALPEKSRPAIRTKPERTEAENPVPAPSKGDVAPTAQESQATAPTGSKQVKSEPTDTVETATPEVKSAPVQKESVDQSAPVVPATFLQATATRYAEKPDKSPQPGTNTEPVGEPHEVIAPAMFLQAMQPATSSKSATSPTDKQSEPVEIDDEVVEDVVLAVDLPIAPVEQQVETNDEEAFEKAPADLPADVQVEAAAEEPAQQVNVQAPTVIPETGTVEPEFNDSQNKSDEVLPQQPVMNQAAAEASPKAEQKPVEPVAEEQVEAPVVSEESESEPLQPTNDVGSRDVGSRKVAEPETDAQSDSVSDESTSQKTSASQTPTAGSAAQTTVVLQNQPVATSDDPVPSPVASTTATTVEPVAVAEPREQLKTPETAAGPRDSLSSPVSVESRPAAATGAKTEVSRPVLDTTRGDVPQKLAGFIQQAAEQGKPLRIRLNPPELGTLQIEIGRHQGQVTARLEVETAAARAVIFEQLSVLRDSLQQQGLKLDQIQIEVNESLSQSSDSGVDGESGSGQFSDEEDPQHQTGYAAGEPAEEETSSRPAAVRNTTGVTEIDVEV